MRNGAIVLNTFMRKLQVVDIGGTRRTMRKRKFCHKSVCLPEHLLQGDVHNLGTFASFYDGKFAVAYYLHRLLTVWDVTATPDGSARLAGEHAAVE